jgi:ribosomal protein S6--L-glutamate ligase
VGNADCGLCAQADDQLSFDLLSFDAVIVRTMPPGSLEQVVYRMDALWRLAAAGVKVLNPPKSLECAVDKYLTLVRLEAAGLTVPGTVVCENSEAALAAFDRLGGDVVVKPIFGSEGRGIVRVSDRELALRTFRTLERIQAVLYVQRFIENQGFDVRVLVLGGRVLAAMRRRANGDFRTNVSCQAIAESHSPTDEEVQRALGAAQAVGAHFAGIDLLYGLDGTCYVIEVNAVPGWRALQRVTGMDVAAAVIASLES